ncbi:UNVERIFIED_CONTAM: Tetratricopeptide repeat protein 36 [Siphonaria sp. JEL0065]|nr:Tetratricopeptide repeat protein 36 [Siphonaria sp. JEL0065]
MSSTTTPKATTANITSRDDKILDAIFSQDFSALDESNNIAKGNTTTKKEPIYPIADPETLAKLVSLEKLGVEAAENNDLELAVKHFSGCIDSWPWYPSAYNNRAQAWRMIGENGKAKEDVEEAIKYAEGQGDEKVLKMAYAQSAVLKKNEGDLVGAEAALLMSARMGNEISKAAVKNNPYAKLCSNMVTELMSKYQPNMSSGSSCE